ncbi:MAG: CHAT domain-containing protein [Thermoanaerobaculia bacterium]
MPTEPGLEPAFAEYRLSEEALDEALLSGAHRELLEDYFGPEVYRELSDLAWKAGSRRLFGGPRVLILPGIMGSTLGRKGKDFDDTLWLDPVDILAGRLGDLALGSRVDIQALGVLQFAYARLKWKLRLSGFNASFHPFDWRRSIPELGRELAQRIAEEGGEKVQLVAHSMGGLVCRSAAAQGALFQRLIMLGTPNLGSFAPVKALRGVNSVVRTVARLDRKHDVAWLVENVFNTFPGLTEMLPTREAYSAIDLFDLGNWPADGLAPRKEILAKVEAVQKTLPLAGENFYLIAGVNQKTVTGLSRDASGEFVYEESQDGDGTVPLAMCLLPAIAPRTWYVEAEHGSLPNHVEVEEAVIDLLGHGTTQLLSQTRPATRGAATRRVPEHRLAAELPIDRGAPLTRSELRQLVREFAAPMTPAPEAPAVAPGEPHPGAGAGSFEHTLDQVVVGRRRQHRLDVQLALGSITEADTRAVALGIFRGVDPTGAARALDERMRGTITELTRRRMLSANIGEIFVLPTGRHELSADLIAFVGLGPFDGFSSEVLQTVAENMLRTFVLARVEEFSTVVLGGSSVENTAGALRNLLLGFVRGLLDADRDHFFRRVVICERDPERFQVLRRELVRLATTELASEVEITFDERKLRESRGGEAGARAVPLPKQQPTYLIARQLGDLDRDDVVEVVSSVLPPSGKGKAAVVSGRAQVASREALNLLARLTQAEARDFARDGAELGKLLLSPSVLEVLRRLKGSPLVVVHDAAMSRVPWETLALHGPDGELWFPARENEGLSHRYDAEQLSVAKWLTERVWSSSLEVLLVVNPTGDLPGATREGERIKSLFKDQHGKRLTVISGADATRKKLIEELGSGLYDVVHYAGHAFFEPANREQSGILAAGYEPVTGADLAEIAKLPALVFFNACESGRVRRLAPGQFQPEKAAAGGAKEKAGAKSRDEHLQAAVSLAESFLLGGVANFLGTYWPVGDEAAETFATTFYRQILDGKTLGTALQAARQGILDTQDWPNYLLYGDAEFRLKVK